MMGKKCQNCRDGYHGMKSHDIFGCKGEALILLSSVSCFEVWGLLRPDLDFDRQTVARNELIAFGCFPFFVPN